MKKGNLILAIIITMACTISSAANAADVCAQWTELLKSLYIPVPENITDGNNTEEKLVILSACPIPGTLADLQAAKNDAYSKLQGRENCSLEEFAALIREGGWNQPMWLMRYNGKIYNQTIVTIAAVDGVTWGMRVNFPKQISGLDKTIAGDGYITPTGIEVDNTVEDVTEMKLFEATT